MTYINFKTMNTAPYSNDPLPKGSYNAIILKVEEKSWDDGGETYLNISLKIIEGSYIDRIAFVKLNINGEYGEQARRILDQICTVCEVKSINDQLILEALYNIPLHIHLGVAESKNGNKYNKLYGVGKVKEVEIPFEEDDLSKNPF